MNNVLIVDDDILVADVIRRIVEQTPAFKCCGIALSLGQAKEIISENKKLADCNSNGSDDKQCFLYT